VLLTDYTSNVELERLQEVQFSPYSDTQWNPSPQLQNRLIRTLNRKGGDRHGRQVHFRPCKLYILFVILHTKTKRGEGGGRGGMNMTFIARG
jgi:hypothetical protein